jgi:hypothetical protein
VTDGVLNKAEGDVLRVMSFGWNEQIWTNHGSHDLISQHRCDLCTCAWPGARQTNLPSMGYWIPSILEAWDQVTPPPQLIAGMQERISGKSLGK